MAVVVDSNIVVLMDVSSRHPRDPWEKRAVLMLVPQIESRITGGA